MKVKRILAGLLVILMMLSLASCKGEESGTEGGKDNSGGSIKDILNQSEKVEYEEDQVLFCAQDRSDNDDDRYTMYFYNYKGDLLKSGDPIGFYAKNGLAPAYDKISYKIGFVDKDGVFQIEAIYDDAGPFSDDGIALVKIEKELEDGTTVGKYGYINSKGEEIIPCIYDGATSFYDCGYAIVTVNRYTVDEYGYTVSDEWKRCIIDEKGDIVIEIDIDEENRDIMAVYEDYFACEVDYGAKIAMFNYSGKKIAEVEQSEDFEDEYKVCVMEADGVYRYTIKDIDGCYAYWNGVEGGMISQKEKFDGKDFAECKSEYEITVKRVATTQSGFGYGIEKNGKILIPFEYDIVYQYGDYYVATKFNGSDLDLDQTIDIYDSECNKTAENIQYAFVTRISPYGEYCRLPNGYFQIKIADEDYGELHGIIDYTGKVIIEPVYGRGIKLATYEGMAIL